MQDFAYICGLVSFCVRPCVTFVRTGRILTKIKNIKKTLIHFDIFHRLVSLRKLYFATLTYFSKVKDSNRDLTKNGERLCKCDECEYCCTQSSSPAGYKFTRSSKRQFKCDECEFKCDKPSNTALRRMSASPLPFLVASANDR